MSKIQLNLVLDDSSSVNKEKGDWYLYQSKEVDDGEPVVNGVYIQRKRLQNKRPASMKLLLEWE